VPPDYVLGPGDSVRVQLFGNVNGVYEFEIGRDGTLTLPELGPVTVSGLTFSEFREDLKNRVDQMLIGTQVSVTMGQLRTVRVFVLGDAARPGSYVVSSLATISSALYQSGGLSEIGSMRNVALKRQGNTVATLDVYDLLLNGDTSGDRRLQSGDVIFVPPVGKSVGVGGAVRRPAIYEVKDKSTVADVIRLAGGLSPEAFPEAARLERIDPAKGRVVLSVNAAGAESNSTVVMNGDILVIPKVLAEVNDAVVLSGHVQRPGPYQWSPGMRLTDLVPSALELAPGADANYILIRRESKTDRTVEVLSADLGAALRSPGSPANILLQGRDSVFVFSLEYGRQRVIAPILDELRLQAQFGSPFSEVTIGGQVRAPGQYPLEAGMRISDLIRAGGSLREVAYATAAELTRYAVIDGEYRAKEIVNIDLDAVLRGNPEADVELSAHDHIAISLLPDWNKNWSVTVEGEVRFSGEYQILQGETLSQLLERAGGLTENASPQGAIFLRESLREREREQMDVLAARMEADLTAMSLETLDTTGTEALQTGKSLLAQLRNAEPVGRLVIDIEQITNRSNTGAALVQDWSLETGTDYLFQSHPRKSR
jgi:protein involved in polysaccharide export with SLBB domain